MNLEEVSALRIGEKQHNNIKSAIDHFIHVRRKYQNSAVS
jgi:hypothetical protein